MAFRGFGDDALKVKADKREAALKAAQIAASERASMRSAAVSAMGIEENARQADMANQLAREQLAAGNERFDKQLAQSENARVDTMNLHREQLADDIVSGQEKRALDEGARRDAMAASEAARKDDLSVKIAEMSQKERQLQLNESTAAKLDAEWQRQQAAQEEMQREDTATQLAVIRAASLSSGPVGMPYINALNDLRGVAYGDPGSTTQVFPVIDPQTGARLGIGTVKIGEDGKEIQSILDPATILPQVRKSMTPEKWEEYARQLIGANTAKGSDRVTAAAIREMQKAKLEFAKSDPASLVKTLAEQEDNLRLTKPAKTGTGKAADPANQENLDRIRRIKTNVLKEMERQTAGEEKAAPAPTLSPEQKKFMELPGEGNGIGAKVEAMLDKGELVVTINGQTARMPDTPKNRATLQAQHNIQIGGETQPATAKVKDAPAASTARPTKPKVADEAAAGDIPPPTEETTSVPPATVAKTAAKGEKRKTLPLGKPLIETDMNAQKSGSNKLPEEVSSQFSKQQEESLTEEDKKAISEIHAASWGQKDPKTGLSIDPKEYSKQKIREYFKQKKEKYDADFNRLFGKFLK